MDIPQAFEQFLAVSRTNIPVVWMVSNLLLSALLAFILSWIYVRYGTSLSNRRSFSKNFLLITLTTVLIISIVKSSLALSLGLVGALSIIRFRAAIKEPEELAYLFLAIGIGLGFGANQGVITIVSFVIIAVLIIFVRKFSHKSYENQNLHLTVSSHNPKKITVEEIVEALKTHCLTLSLKRIEESSEVLEASFLVEFSDFGQLNEAKNALQELSSTLKFSFLDNKGLY